MDVISDVVNHHEFLKQFTLQQMRSRYRGSVLGFFWVLMVPMLSCAVLSFVWAMLNPTQFRNILPWLLSGYSAWIFFSGSVSTAIFSIVGNSVFVTKIKAPKIVFPIVAVILGFIELLVFLVAVLITLTLIGTNLTAAILFLPISILLLTIFTVGFACLMAALNVFVRDVAFAWQPLSFLWFLLTPIFYRIESISPSFRPLFEANPLVPFVRLFQDPVANGVIPSSEFILTSALYAAIMFTFGAAVFARSQKSFYSYI